MATLSEIFTNIANAIRGKTGKTTTMTPAEMATEINNLVLGNLSNVTGGDFLVTVVNNTPYEISIGTCFLDSASGGSGTGSNTATLPVSIVGQSPNDTGVFVLSVLVENVPA